MAETGDDWQPALLRDFELFQRLSRKGKPDELIAAAGDDLRELLAGQIMGYGMRNWGGPEIPEIRGLYRYCLLTGMPDHHRWQVFACVNGAVQQMSHCGIDAYLPFIAEDPDRRIASTATIEYASNGPLVGDDPMSRVKDIIELIRGEPLANTGAVFGGLLCLGDPRVCRLLLDVRDELSLDQALEAGGCWSGTMSAASIEFILGWLESLEGRDQDVLFGNLAANLVLQKRHATMPMVMTGTRPFPVTSVTPKEHGAMMKLVPFEQYRERIAPRLLALERMETPPKSMSAVISTWGIAERDLSAFPDLA